MRAYRNNPLPACDGRFSRSCSEVASRGRIGHHGLDEAYQLVNLHDDLARHASCVRVKGNTAWQMRHPRVLRTLVLSRPLRRRPNPGGAAVLEPRLRPISSRRRLWLRSSRCPLRASLRQRRRQSRAVAGRPGRRARKPVLSRVSFPSLLPPRHPKPLLRRRQSRAAIVVPAPR